jgi:hypothetical protein
MRKQSDTIDGEEYTTGSSQREQEWFRLMMSAQVEPGDYQGEQERCSQKWLQIAISEQKSCPQGRKESDQGRKPQTAERGKKGSEGS